VQSLLQNFVTVVLATKTLPHWIHILFTVKFELILNSSFQVTAKIWAKKFQSDNFATYKTLIIKLLSPSGEITGVITTDDWGN